MNNEMFTVNGKNFIKSHFVGASWKKIEKLFKNAKVSDETVRKAWEQANPEKVKPAKPEPEDSTED